MKHIHQSGARNATDRKPKTMEDHLQRMFLESHRHSSSQKTSTKSSAREAAPKYVRKQHQSGKQSRPKTISDPATSQNKNKSKECNKADFKLWKTRVNNPYVNPGRASGHEQQEQNRAKSVNEANALGHTTRGATARANAREGRPQTHPHQDTTPEPVN